MIFNQDSIYTEEELTEIKEARNMYYHLLKVASDAMKKELKENGNDFLIDIAEKKPYLPNVELISFYGAEIVRLEYPGRKKYYEAHNTIESLNAEVKRIIADVTAEDLEGDYMGNGMPFSPKDKDLSKESLYYRRCLLIIGLQIETLKYYVLTTKEFSQADGQAFVDNFNASFDKKIKELLPGVKAKAARKEAEEELTKENYDYIAWKKEHEENTELDADIAKAPSFTPLDVIKPLNYTILNSAISNNYLAIEDNLLRLNNDGQMAFIAEPYAVSVGDKARPVTTLVSLVYEGELSGRLSLLKGYDNTVLNAICSLIQANNRTFTINDIYRTLTGNSERRPQPKQKEMIKASMLKLSQTRITIDRTEEAKNNMLTDEEGNRITSLKIKDTLISYREAEVKTENGRVINAYEIKSEPPLLQYARDKRQLISFPTSLLCFESVSSTQDNIVIAEYLVKQIVLMAKGKRDNKVISFDTICQATSISTDKDKTEFKRFRDTVYKILDELLKKPEIKQYKLKGYEERKEGRTITGVKLIFDK